MRAVRFAEYGGPDVLSVQEVERPRAGPGQVRIAVRAAGVNAMDWKIRAGHLRRMMELSLPAGIGIDAAGTVDQVGDGVDGVSLGDAVFGSGSATYAVQQTFPLENAPAAQQLSEDGHVVGRLVVTVAGPVPQAS